MSEQEKRPGTGAVNRLPRGIRGLIRLAMVNRRVDHVIENQTKLGKQLQRLDTQVQEQNARLGDALSTLHDMLPTVNQHNERLGQITQELQSLRARLNRLETYLPQLRASKAPVGSKKVPTEEAKAAIDKVEHWYHRIQLAPGIVTPGIHDSDAALEAMDLPERLDGMRVLDVGARDGYFSFVAEARGAEVLAIDSVAPEHLMGFSTAAEFMESSVEYRTMNVYDVDPEEIGTFDVVFFLGVLYHLRDPLFALDRLSEVAKPGSTIWVESHVIDRGFVDPKTQEFRKLSSIAPNLVDVPMAQFYPDRLLAQNPTNWWGPNLAGLKAMVESAGFEVLRSRLIGTRGLVVARKVEDAEITFYRNFDREEMTGDEGMAWEDVKKWIETKKTREAARRRDRSSQPEDA